MPHRSSTCALAILALGVTVAGCVPVAPVVTEYNGASVTIQQDTLFQAANGNDPAVVAEANRICATAGNRAEYASTVQNPQTYTASHLFLCL